MANILLISDDCRIPTGVGNQSQEIVKGLIRKGHTLYQIAPHFQDRPATTTYFKFETGEEITIYATRHYDDIDLILKVIRAQNIQAVILFTDPHKFRNIFLNYRAIRNQCPLIFYTIWDSWLNADAQGKPHYNSWIYESCTHLACISKQTENFVRTIVNRLDTKPTVSYLPHGIDPNIFKPLPESELTEFRKHFFGGKEFDFVVLFNSRNQLRKKPIDLLYCFQKFVDSLPTEEAKKVALIFHTEPVADTGTNLIETIQALAPRAAVYIDSSKPTPEQLNRLYNISDLLVAPSNAEGWGLTPHEFVMAGGVTALSVTGGLQDQCGFENEQGEPMTFSEDYTNNSTGKYGKHGTWVYPIFPVAHEIIGHPGTPYLENSVISHQGIVDALNYWHNIPRAERKARGLEGRNYFIERKLTNADMVNNFDTLIADAVGNFKRESLFEAFAV